MVLWAKTKGENESLMVTTGAVTALDISLRPNMLPGWQKGLILVLIWVWQSPGPFNLWSRWLSLASFCWAQTSWISLLTSSWDGILPSEFLEYIIEIESIMEYCMDQFSSFMDLLQTPKKKPVIIPSYDIYDGWSNGKTKQLTVKPKDLFKDWHGWPPCHPPRRPAWGKGPLQVANQLTSWPASNDPKVSKHRKKVDTFGWHQTAKLFLRLGKVFSFKAPSPTCGETRPVSCGSTYVLVSWHSSVATLHPKWSAHNEFDALVGFPEVSNDVNGAAYVLGCPWGANNWSSLPEFKMLCFWCFLIATTSSFGTPSWKKTNQLTGLQYGRATTPPRVSSDRPGTSKGVVSGSLPLTLLFKMLNFVNLALQHSQEASDVAQCPFLRCRMDLRCNLYVAFHLIRLQTKGFRKDGCGGWVPKNTCWNDPYTLHAPKAILK